jgi:hypothetical protein
MDFTLSIATPEDIPSIVDIWYAAFRSPTSLRVLPETPAVKSWLASSMRRNIMGEDGGGTTYIVVKEEKSGRVGAFARWFLESGESDGADEGKRPKKRNGVSTWWERWVGEGGSLGEGIEEEVLGDEFFEPMQRQHEVVVGGRPHYCNTPHSAHPQEKST